MRRGNGRQREDPRSVKGRMSALGKSGDIVGCGEEVCGAEAMVGVEKGGGQGRRKRRRGR